MPKLEKTMLKDIKTSAPRTMQAFVTFMESQRTDPELWFSTLVANLPQGTVLTSELAQINKQAVSYWVRHKQLKELILSKLPTVRATDDQKEIHIVRKLRRTAIPLMAPVPRPSIVTEPNADASRGRDNLKSAWLQR